MREPRFIGSFNPNNTDNYYRALELIKEKNKPSDKNTLNLPKSYNTEGEIYNLKIRIRRLEKMAHIHENPIEAIEMNEMFWKTIG